MKRRVRCSCSRVCQRAPGTPALDQQQRLRHRIGNRQRNKQALIGTAPPERQTAAEQQHHAAP